MYIVFGSDCTLATLAVAPEVPPVICSPISNAVVITPTYLINVPTTAPWLALSEESYPLENTPYSP